jgi:hypothetical protein
LGPEIDQKVGKTAARPISSSARGGLEPAFRVLFSAIFHGVSLEDFYQDRNLWKWAETKCGILSRRYIQSFYGWIAAALPRGCHLAIRSIPRLTKLR